MLAIIHLVITLDSLDWDEPRNALELVHAVRTRTIASKWPFVYQMGPIERHVGVVDFGGRHLGRRRSLRQ